jgi:hypothetical protein
MSASEFVAFWSGISSVSGSRLMTTPAAWVEALPGDALELAGEVRDPLDRGSPSTIWRRSGEISIASSSRIPSWFGTAFAIRSTSP